MNRCMSCRYRSWTSVETINKPCYVCDVFMRWNHFPRDAKSMIRWPQKDGIGGQISWYHGLLLRPADGMSARLIIISLPDSLGCPLSELRKQIFDSVHEPSESENATRPHTWPTMFVCLWPRFLRFQTRVIRSRCQNTRLLTLRRHVTDLSPSHKSSFFMVSLSLSSVKLLLWWISLHELIGITHFRSHLYGLCLRLTPTGPPDFPALSQLKPW